MDNSAFTSYHVEERSFVAYLKREIHNLAGFAKFTEKQRHEIDIVVSELSSNLIKHVGGGELLYRISTQNENASVFEVIAIDNGPGMADVARMMKDGVSTVGTLGHGLGAIERLSTVSQLYSIPGWGTIHYSMIGHNAKNEYKFRKESVLLNVVAVCVNKPRETACGDGYSVKETSEETQIFFGDGLGHGEHAKEAVDVAASIFLECKSSDPVEIIREIHEHVRRTRGLVATVAVFDKKLNEWRVAGVGNILSRMYTGIQSRNYMSYNGTVGLNLPSSMSTSRYPIEKNQQLIMCTDGIKTRWDLNKYNTIFKYDPVILASAVYKDFSRGNDDASVLIAKVI
jgi:anti-sigma regulatory factor (Ser/Thr protein kinase)